MASILKLIAGVLWLIAGIYAVINSSVYLGIVGIVGSLLIFYLAFKKVKGENDRSEVTPA